MQRILVLGGTGWLGRETASAWARRGAEVVCLARGVTGPVPDGVRLVVADRTQPGAYDGLDGDWDAVVELAAPPALVEGALGALADRAAHWTLVSSVSVYARTDERGADESAELVTPTDPSDYAHAKVLAEQASTARLGDRLLIARPGLIVGPGDPSDRFGYWPARLMRGGTVLLPEPAGRWVQAIDVADLAEWIVSAGAGGLTGTVDAVGPSTPFEEFLAAVRSATGFDGEFAPRSDEWLREHRIDHWAGPRSLPLSLPRPDTAFARRSGAAYRASGGVFRPLSDTVERVLSDEIARGLGRARRSGLAWEVEREALGAVHPDRVRHPSSLNE
ncbi:reductase [Rathayibacter sp. Leaf299]|uniref:NAD-dependent epimerase/dehydratase family protein n=1 Tax=Rathayibacter sp. Leaf299 TaxID=1736328 RepID=UPI000701DE60|nr:NAD-dependent epimerase/dehydratase family protein [Rathayibacter sp. Leaf299]KQQ21822.1 reductase [Rathayibacter sp. Leaf299]